MHTLLRIFAFVFSIAFVAMIASPDAHAQQHRRHRHHHQQCSETIQRTDYNIPIGQNQWLHAQETWTECSQDREDPRLVVAGTPPLLTGASLNTGLPNYDLGNRLAENGYTSVVIDPPGTGGSYLPSDGRVVTTQFMANAYRTAIVWLLSQPRFRDVEDVDFFGEGGASGLAGMHSNLCGDRHLLRSFATASQLYKTPTDFTMQTLLSPGFHDLVDFFASQQIQIGPNATDVITGYLPVAPQNFVANSPLYFGIPQNVLDALALSQGGQLMPTGYYYELYDHLGGPTKTAEVDPGSCQVPGLFIIAQNDPISTLADNTALVNDYGRFNHHGEAVLRITAPGAHDPRLGETNSQDFWRFLLDHLDDNGDDCEDGHGHHRRDDDDDDGHNHHSALDVQLTQLAA